VLPSVYNYGVLTTALINTVLIMSR
jgi:hypothetical protein